MLKAKRHTLARRQDEMFRRHHHVRPYDYVRKEQDISQRNRILVMIDRGMSVEEIAAVSGLTKIGVQLYKDLFYLPWKQRLVKPCHRGSNLCESGD
jgi:hypothetical protein